MHDRRIVLIVWAVIVALTARVPQGVSGDPAAQLRAAQQYVAGTSPSLNTVVEPTFDDLTRDNGAWIVWWPPGPQLATVPWMTVGASVGTSVRIAAALCLLFGALGWLAWFRGFDLPSWLGYAVAAGLPCLHQGNGSLFVFNQDVLSFAVAPWLLVLVRRLDANTERPRASAWFAVGVALGATYVIKYSLLFVGLGALAYLAAGWRRRPGWPALAAVGCAIPVAALTALNLRYGGVANSASQAAGLHVRWQSIVALVANPALAAADADGLWRYVLLHPGREMTTDELAPAYVGLAAGVVLLWLLARWRARTPAERLAVTVFAVTMAMVAATWTFSGAADYMARHVGPASLAILPVAYRSGADVWRGDEGRRVRVRRVRVRRAIVAIVGLGFVVAPVMYGAVSVVGKLARVPRSYAVGPSGLYNPLLASDSLAVVERRIIARFGAVTDVWYPADAVTMLDLPGRVWALSNLDFVPVEKMRQIRFRTSGRVRLTVLMPPRFEAEGKGAAVRDEFPGAGVWTRTVVPGSNYDVWTSVIEPTS